MLQNNVVSIKFRKSDGSERLMKCTLLTHYVKPYEKKTEREKKLDENLISVWDVEKDAWRSFRLDSIMEIYK